MNPNDELVQILQNREGYTFMGVIHKGEQWVKFYDNRNKYVCAIQLNSGLTDEEFLKKWDYTPF